MPPPKHSVDSVVEHPTKLDWGRGRVEAVEGHRVLVRWTGVGAKPIWMRVDAVPLSVAADQSDPFPGRKSAPAAKAATSRPRAAAPMPTSTFRAPTHDSPDQTHP